MPGIAPSIFFWQHTGSQTRADVGLSKVNNLEADMVCRLAKYLVYVAYEIACACCADLPLIVIAVFRRHRLL